MTDLSCLEQQTPRKNDRKEAAALVEVLKALNTHPTVAWCERMKWSRPHRCPLCSVRLQGLS